ncbi:substrate-binding domain-containing protein [candidate division KSB1 bacterium]|nr:substrate-binding domain-containing protein [candidate division KSB1 bacterium]
MPRLFYVLLAIVLLFMACQQQSSNQITIAVIPKGTTAPFWNAVKAGAIQAAQELGVKMLWMGPELEDNRQQQIALVDNQVMNQVSGIVLAPLDENALRRPVRSAVDRGIPVVIMDSGLKDAEDIYSSFVATDNYLAGKLAAEHMGEILEGKGRIVVLRYLEGSASTDKRENGFMEGLKAFPAMKIISDEQYGGPTKAKAQQVSENIIMRFRNDTGDAGFDGAFCPNGAMTYGMLQALKRSRLLEKVRIIGIDADPALVTALENREVAGLVVQNPIKIGYQSVKTMFQVLQGQNVEKRIDTGVVFISPDDLAKPDIKELIYPDLDKWLSQY